MLIPGKGKQKYGVQVLVGKIDLHHHEAEMGRKKEAVHFGVKIRWCWWWFGII